VFTAQYALSPYTKQIHFVFKGLKTNSRNGLNKLQSSTVVSQTYINHAFPATSKNQCEIRQSFSPAARTSNQGLLSTHIEICKQKLHFF
jgi:hypothetical protein